MTALSVNCCAPRHVSSQSHTGLIHISEVQRGSEVVGLPGVNRKLETSSLLSGRMQWRSTSLVILLDSSLTSHLVLGLQVRTRAVCHRLSSHCTSTRAPGCTAEKSGSLYKHLTLSAMSLVHTVFTALHHSTPSNTLFHTVLQHLMKCPQAMITVTGRKWLDISETITNQYYWEPRVSLT
jgi:hypothetical protein